MRIKCPHCNGKGFSEINSALNLTCGWCMGQGELDLEIVPIEPQTEAEIEKKWKNTIWDTDVYLDDIDGKEPMTNEEWLKRLDTEQLEQWLRGIYWHCHEIDCKHCNYPWRCMEKGDIVKWLKQPHTNE